MTNTCDSTPRDGGPPAPGHRSGRAAAAAAVLLAAAATGIAPPASAEPPCVRAHERAAFDVRALQTQLMVVALTCERQDDYNAFVQRHQRGLHTAYLDITSHFRRLHGAAEGEQQRDAYITELANLQSHDGMRHGAAFCGAMAPLFRRALAAEDAGQVARLSAASNLAAPAYAVAACAAPPANLEAAPAAPPPAGPEPAGKRPAPRGREVAGGEQQRAVSPAQRPRDNRDEEISRLQARLEQLERALVGRQAEPAPVPRRADPAAPVLKAER